MAKFRKKPVVIDAWQNVSGAILPDWLQGHNPGSAVEIMTLEGTMRADPWDWIIKGVKGEVYPIKDDIFRQTYEPADG